MTPANDHIATKWMRALNGRSVDALCALAHPEIELVPTDYTAPPGTAFHGHRGIRTFAGYMFERYPSLRVEVDELRELDEVLLMLCTMVRDREGGGEPEVVPRALLFELEGDLVRRLRVYHTEAEALEAAARSVRNGFRAVFDNALEPILLLEERGRLADLNRSASRLLEIDRDEGGPPDLREFVGDNRGPWDAAWKTLKEERRAAGSVRVRTRSGREVPVNYWATADFTPGHHLLLLREAQADATAQPVLTAREREVLGLLATGLTARQVAERLVLSPATVRTHVQNAVSRLEASTRVQAIAIAISRGEIDP